MFGIGVQELLIVLVIALFVFGGKNLPQIGGDMGRAIKNFRKAVNEPESIEIKPTPQEPRP